MARRPRRVYPEGAQEDEEEGDRARQRARDARRRPERTVEISLNGAGKRLLAKHHQLKAQLTLTQAGESTVYPHTITFKTKPKTRKHKH